MIPLETRRQMIEREKGPMSICYQCELLGIVRSSLYYTPSKASNKGLQLMEEPRYVRPGPGSQKSIYSGHYVDDTYPIILWFDFRSKKKQDN